MLSIDGHNQGIFSPKLEHFLPVFQKGQGRPLPLPLLYLRVCSRTCATNEEMERGKIMQS